MPAHDMTSAPMITCAGCKQSYADSALFCPNCGTAKPRDTAASTDPLIGKVLGERFQVLEFLGQGASGTIYRAEHITLRRRVAIKVLHNELSRDDLAVERFRREATTVAEIDNEHIVEIHDFGRTHDGRLYLAMELLEGETLDIVLGREKTLSVERAADILIQVGEALMEAHAIGYVHRDLRPRNVYLAVRRGKANFVKLLDFGLAKLVETDAQAASTSLGMTFGDPRYMSPEQARGDRIDRRADIYQLGCVAYEMLTGSPPFTGNRVFDILSKQVTEIPAPLPTRRPGVPLWVEAAVAKMLAKDPENRFATTTRMVEALRLGLETGQIMEDEIARRRESIPPPSVSRVMQKMGLPGPIDPSGRNEAGQLQSGPLANQPVTNNQTLKGHLEPQAGGTLSGPATAPGSPFGPPAMPSPAAPPVGSQTAHGVPSGFGSQTAHGAPSVGSQTAHGVPSGFGSQTAHGFGSQTAHGVPAAPNPTAPSVGSQTAHGVPAGFATPSSGAPLSGPPVMPAPVVAPPIVPAPVAAAPLVVEAPRRRTGTPQIGVPAVAVPDQPAVAGQIEPTVKSPTGPVDAAPIGRAKRASSAGAPSESSVWFEEGESASAEAERIRGRKRSISSSPSSTDLSLYDDMPAQRRRWPLAVGGLLLLGVVGGALALGMSHSDKKTKPSQTQVATPTPPPVIGSDVPPSQILDQGSAQPTTLPPPVIAAKTTETKPAKDAKDPKETHHASPSSGGSSRPTRTSTKPDTDDAAARRPTGGGWFDTPKPDTTPTTTPVTTPATTPTGPAGVSGTDGPVDPYGGGGDTPPADGASPDKKAEFFANVGQQQLASSDTTGAAASFKKALELDPKNVVSVIGMGDIALRQGLFGDAIAHLKKAARLAPKSSRVFTLLGEAYLNSGNNAVAAENFKKALQLDPDNTRARDGYNEASSKVPPPSDDTP